MSEEPEIDELRAMGRYSRYVIYRADGTPTGDADYFVLRLDDGGDDPRHIAACRKAIRVYAEAIRDHLPKLAQDLLNQYSLTPSPQPLTPAPSP